MRVEDKTGKLKARLDHWQAYVEQSQAQGKAPPGEPETELFAWDAADAQPSTMLQVPQDVLSDVETSRADERPSFPVTQYKEQLADLQAKLDRERSQARQLAAKLADEVMRSRQERHAVRQKSSLLRRRSAPLPDREGRERKLNSVLWIFLVVLVAAFGSLLAFTLEN
jgi:hypothetical protein